MQALATYVYIAKQSLIDKSYLQNYYYSAEIKKMEITNTIRVPKRSFHFYPKSKRKLNVSRLLSNSSIPSSF